MRRLVKDIKEGDHIVNSDNVALRVYDSRRSERSDLWVLALGFGEPFFVFDDATFEVA